MYKPEIFIETPRLLLRQWHINDIPVYCALNLDPVVMEFFPSVTGETASREHAEKIQKMISQKGYGLFAVERKDSGSFIGFTGLSHPSFKAPFTPCTEIGWRLAKEHWGNGFATEAAKAVLQFAFNKLNFTEILSFTATLNKRSENIMQKTGMQKKENFLHPSLPNGHRLQEHVLYSIQNNNRT